MRQNTQLEWEILEAEEEEWAEVTMTAAGARRPVRWQWLATALGAGALLIALAVMTGYRLMQEAEAGIAATGQHIGALVEIETIRQQQSDPASGLTADVQSVDIIGSAAMVRMVMTQTSSLGEVCPHKELLFYRRFSAGWTRTGPIAAFWGEKEAIETPTLHFDFHELDRPYVEAVAGPVDRFHRTLREFLGLPPMGATERVTVTVVPRNVSLDLLVDGTLVNSSPLLRDCNGGCERTTKFSAGLRAQLVTRSLQESRVRNHVRPTWEPMVSVLADWLIGHADELSATMKDGAPVPKNMGTACRTYLLRCPITDYAAYSSYPGYGEYRRMADAYAGYQFYDALVADRGHAAIPALLAAFGTEETWPDVVRTACGVSVEESQAEWNAYLLTLRKTLEPAADEVSRFAR